MIAKTITKTVIPAEALGVEHEIGESYLCIVVIV